MDRGRRDEREERNKGTRKEENVIFVVEGRMREKEWKKGAVLRKGLSMKERRQEGRKDGHKLSEREEGNEERKEWREGELVDVEIRKGRKEEHIVFVSIC